MEGVRSNEEEDQQQFKEETLIGAHPHAPISAQEPAAKAAGYTTYNVVGQGD